MSAPPPGPGYGRGGRGAALEKALSAPVRQPGGSPPGASSPAGAPLGRGAMLAHMQASVGRGAPMAAAPPAQVPLGKFGLSNSNMCLNVSRL